jgi:hypothetical protein
VLAKERLREFAYDLMLKERMADGHLISFEQFCFRNTLRISEIGGGFSRFGKERGNAR